RCWHACQKTDLPGSGEMLSLTRSAAADVPYRCRCRPHGPSPTPIEPSVTDTPQELTTIGPDGGGDTLGSPVPGPETLGVPLVGVEDPGPAPPVDDDGRPGTAGSDAEAPLLVADERDADGGGGALAPPGDGTADPGGGELAGPDRAAGGLHGPVQ